MARLRGLYYQAEVAKRLELTRPMMRCGARFDANQAGWQLLEECQDVAALQLTADDHLAFRVNALRLKSDLAMSKPIVVIVRILGSTESWGP